MRAYSFLSFVTLALLVNAQEIVSSFAGGVTPARNEPGATTTVTAGETQSTLVGISSTFIGAPGSGNGATAGSPILSTRIGFESSSVGGGAGGEGGATTIAGSSQGDTTAAQGNGATTTADGPKTTQTSTTANGQTSGSVAAGGDRAQGTANPVLNAKSSATQRAALKEGLLVAAAGAFVSIAFAL